MLWNVQYAATNMRLAIIAASMLRFSKARCGGSADWLFRAVGVDLSDHSLLLLMRVMVGGKNNGDYGWLHVLAAMLGLSIGARGANPCYDNCRASAHSAAERRRHSYLRGLYHDAVSSDQTTNSTVQMLQLVARAACFRVEDWSDTDASEVGFLCLDLTLDLSTIVYDQPAFEQASSKRYRQPPPKRRKA